LARTRRRPRAGRELVERTGLDLVRLGTEADAEEIQDTAITQPLIVALSLLGYEQLEGAVKVPSDAPVAGIRSVSWPPRRSRGC